MVLIPGVCDTRADSDDNESPSKNFSNGDRPGELQPLSARDETNSRRVFSRSPSLRPSVRSETRGNATFLTECSFAVAHDRLVQVITDVEPFEPHWENLASINLSGKRIESAARLKEFLPRLNSLNM
jgi:protein NUD1